MLRIGTEFKKVIFLQLASVGGSMVLPYVSVAVICQTVIEDKNGVLSLIRIADSVEYEIPKNAPPDALPVIQMMGLVSLKSGPAKGKYKLHMVLNSPSGVQSELPMYDAQLLGGENGYNLVLEIRFTVKEDGLHWFDVMFENTRLTRMPLTVRPATTPEIVAKS
jgi:hypothetical protein